MAILDPENSLQYVELHETLFSFIFSISFHFSFVVFRDTWMLIEEIGKIFLVEIPLQFFNI